MNPFHLTLAQALSRMPGPYGDHYAIMLERGTLEVGLYTPKVTDPQTPHTRDELYVVMRGSGWFRNGPDRVAFGPGDVLFGWLAVGGLGWLLLKWQARADEKAAQD